MRTTYWAASIVAATTLLVFVPGAQAADDGSLSGQHMQTSPTTMGGATDMPTAKPDDGSNSAKAMKDSPTTMGGQTDMPNAKPHDGSLVGKEMEDAPGAQK